MKLKSYLIFFLSITYSAATYASSPVKVRQMMNNKDWNFVENKGQLADHNVSYYGHSNGVYLYCKPGAISFVFTKVENENNGQISEATGLPVETGCIPSLHGIQHQPTPSPKGIPSDTITTSRTDLVLLNSNPNAQILASDQQAYYENYYTTTEQSGQATGNANHGFTNIHTYKTITYKNIYPYIDMVLNPRPLGVEYSFVVHPGGNVSDIQIQWNGLENMQMTQNGGIKYALSLGVMIEGKPVSFQGTNEITSSFIKKYNTTCFKVNGYDKSKDLIIDPTLSWGTYYGGGNTDHAYGVSTDVSGNVCIVGLTMSSGGIATSGAYRTDLAGHTQACFVAKFNSSGSRLWATYYGDYLLNCVGTDGSGNIYVTGSTSTSGEATSGAYQTSFAGGIFDAIIAKFGSNGNLSWSTYYGGSEDDYGSGVSVDDSNDVYVTGYTNSTSDIATSGAYQTSHGTTIGGTDAFLVKFDTNGNRLWGTYFGGSKSDQANAVATDKASNVYITGFTVSSSGIATAGAFQTSFLGSNSDGFLAKFDHTGDLKWATYYGGKIECNGNSLATDDSGDVYMTGNTFDDSGIATLGAYLTSLQGSDDAFIAKFAASGSLKWGTYYGGKSTDQANGIATGVSGNVYITGYTESDSGIATTGANQTSYGGAENVFLANFNGSGSLKWATYYGGDAIDEGYGISADKSGNVYITGMTSGSGSGIATSGGYQTSDGGGVDAYLAKFDFESSIDAGIDSISNPSATFCAGQQAVKVKLKNYGAQELDSVKINWSINSKPQTIYKWTGSLKSDSTAIVSIDTFNFISGKDTIRAWTSMPNGVTDSIPDNDSAIVIDSINPSPSASVIADTAICLGVTQMIGDTGVSGDTYAWISVPSGFTSTDSNPSVSPMVTTQYKLTETITATGCSKTDSVTVTINPLPVASIITDTAICDGVSLSIGNTSVTGESYAWISTPSGYTSTSSNPSVSPTATTKYYLADTITATGCGRTDSVTISVNPLPTVSVILDTSLCNGATISIGGAAVKGSSYVWASTTTGFSSTLSDPSISPAKTDVYVLTVTDTNGCGNDKGVTIDVNPLPATVLVADTVTCAGSSVPIGSVGVSGESYAWTSVPAGFSSTSSNPSVSPTVATKYILADTITATGCNKMDTVTVRVSPLPVAAVSAHTTVCSGTAVSIGASAVSGNSYSWTSSPTGFTSTISNPTVSPTNTTIYTLAETITATGCSNSNIDTVTVVPYPLASVIPSKSVCKGSSIAIGAAAVSGHNYSWTSSPAGFSSTISDPTVSPLASTTYTLTEINPVAGCKTSNSVTLTALPLPTATVAKDTGECGGATGTFFIGSSSVAGNSYSWTSTPAGFSSTSSDPSVSPSVTTIYTMTETISSTGCQKSNSTTVGLYPIPAANAGKNATICQGDLATIGGTGVTGNTYSWTSNPGGFTFSGTSISFYPTYTATYYLTETSATGCVNSNSVTITVNPLPDAHWTVILDNSGNASFSADSINNRSYLWDYGDNNTSNIASPTTLYTKYGKYKVSLVTTNSYGCTSSFDSTINYHSAGIEGDVAQTLNLSLFPNPFSSSITIQYTLLKPSNVNIAIFDITGRQIGIIENNTEATGTYSLDFNTEKYHLTPGLYLLKFMTDDGYVSKQIEKITN